MTATQKPEMGRQRAVRSIIFSPITVAILGVVAPIAFASFGLSAAAVFAFLGAVLLLVLPKIDTVVEIAFGPLRAKLERKVEETEATLRELRSLALVLADPVMSSAVRLGRWNTALSREERLRLYERTKAALRRLRASDLEIADASREHHRFVLFDLSQPIASAIDAVLEKKSKERSAVTAAMSKQGPISDLPAWNAAVERVRKVESARAHFKELARVSNLESYAEAVVRALKVTHLFVDKEREALLENIKEDLEEMRYYVRNREFRSVERWLAGGEN
jgi:hypothetical protein